MLFLFGEYEREGLRRSMPIRNPLHFGARQETAAEDPRAFSRVRILVLPASSVRH
jgi:hypothetical protein